jgi:hypothetical protein
MRLVRLSLTLVIFILAAAPAFSQSKDEQCTSAVILPAGSVTGGPVLWKNRDTDFLSNLVVYVDEQPYDYLGLANAGTPSGRSVWAGLNSEGFGIINTVAYNLPEGSDEMADLEGIIMADALRTCRTVSDFEVFLRKSLGPELGSLANFGVIDAEGGAMLFEVHNHGFEKVDPADAHNSCLINTNFARTGKNGGGAGYLRFERATQLLGELPAGPVDWRTVLTRFSRDTGHVLVDQPTPLEMMEVPDSQPLWVNTRDTINKAYTSATVVLVGRQPDNPESVATMWVIPGEPVTAVAVPLWVEAGASPDLLWRGETAPMWDESARIKKLGRPSKKGGKEHYLNLTALDNAQGTGYLPGLISTEKQIIALTDDFLKRPHTADEFRQFQDRMAERAYQALKAVPSR